MKNALLKNCNKKAKGSILVLTLITVNCLLLLSIYLVNKIESINFYNSNNTAVVLKENSFQKQKEFLLSRFNNYLITNINKIKESGFDTYFNGFKNNPIVSYEKASVKYDKVAQKFFIEIPVDSSFIKFNFKVEVSENKFKYTF